MNLSYYNKYKTPCLKDIKKIANLDFEWSNPPHDLFIEGIDDGVHSTLAGLLLENVLTVEGSWVACPPLIQTKQTVNFSLT